MTRNVSNKLHKLSTNTAYLVQARKILSQKTDGITNIARFVKGISAAITKDNIGNPDNLIKDLRNTPFHVFGRHENCR